MEERPEVGSLFTFPRRFAHPTSGRSPDSRFIGLTAFPTSKGQWLLWPVLHDYSGGAVPDSHRLPY